MRTCSLWQSYLPDARMGSCPAVPMPEEAYCAMRSLTIVPSDSREDLALPPDHLFSTVS